MTKLDAIKGFVGDVARPFAIISTSFGATWATIAIANKVKDGNDGAIFIGAVFLGVAGFYTAKAVEVFKGRKADADVEIAKAQAGGPPQG